MNSNNSHIIHKKLHRFFKKYYFNELIKGFILFFLFSFFYLFVLLLIEFFFWLSPDTRKWLFYSIFPVLFLFFYFFLFEALANLFSLKQSMTKEKAALLIGEHFPEVSDKLLNLLQLQSSSQHSDLISASIQQKTEEIKPYRFEQVIDFKQNKKFIPLLFIPFFILIFIKLSGLQKDFSSSYKRIVSYNTSFIPPAPFRLHILSPQKFTAGEDYSLEVSLSGSSIPEKLYFSMDGKNYTLLQRQNDTLFSIIIPNPPVDLSIFFKSGKYHFGPYNIHGFFLPEITNIRLYVQYPDYLGLKDEFLSQFTNITLPEQSKLLWKVFSEHTDSIGIEFNRKLSYIPVKDSLSTIRYNLQNDLIYRIFPSKDTLQQTSELYRINSLSDEPPSIKVDQFIDSIASLHFHHITATDDHGVKSLEIYYKPVEGKSFNKQRIPIPKSDFIEAFFRFPTDLQIDSLASGYVYYFKVVDNFPYRTQSASSKKFYYHQLKDNEREELFLQQQKNLFHQLSKSEKSFSKQKQSLNRFANKITAHKQLNWQTRQQLEKSIEEQKTQEIFFKESLKKFQRILQALPQDSISTKKDLQKRLEELAEMNKKKKLLDELQKLAEKLDKEQLLKKIDELKNYSEHQEKSLERMLELTKKYYLRQKLNKLSDSITELSKKQSDLAKKSTDSPQQQDSINRIFDKLKQELDSLQKMNSSLKNPMKLNPLQMDAQEIKLDLNKASQQLKNNQIPSSNNSQQKAANKMNSLASKMKMSMSGGGEQHSEDIATLQSLLKSLLHFSFREENLLNQYRGGSIRKDLANHLLDQNKQKTYFKSINDSLYTLALRNPRISQKLLDLSYEIDSELNFTLQKLSELQAYSATQHAQFVLTYSNTLADLLSQALDNEKNSASSKGQGQGKKGGQSFSLPDIIKKQGQAIRQAEKSLKQGKKTKKGKDKSSNNRNSKQESARNYQLYKQQQQIKDALEQLKDRFSNNNKQKIDQLLKQIDHLNKRLLREGITRQTIESLKQIHHKLLQLQNATFMQEEENKRISNNANEDYSVPDSIFYKKNTKFAPSIEWLKRNKLPVNQEVKKKIIEYISHD